MWEASQITPEQIEHAKAPLSAVLKTIVSVVGGAGSVIALFRTSLDMLQNRSLIAKRDSELEHAGKLADLLTKFSTECIPQEHKDPLNNIAQSNLQECLANIARLSSRLEVISQDPNYTLSMANKLLLAFRPATWRGWILHLLTYASAAWCAWYVFNSGVTSGESGFSVEEFLTEWQRSGVYLGLAFSLVMVAVFREWALEERRRSLGYRKPEGNLARWLVMRFPENSRMLLAQVLFFISSMALLTIIHGAIRDQFARSKIKSWDTALVYASIVLIAVLVFRTWALQELAYHQQRPQLVRWKKALFGGFFKNLRVYGWLRISYFVTFVPLALFTLLMIVLAIIVGFMGGFFLGLLCFVILPLPSLAFSYALFRSVKIKYSLAEEQERTNSQETLAFSAPV